MNISNTRRGLERLDNLIRLKATGTPKDLASRLNITERTVYRIIKQLKEMGCPVYFNKEIGSYCYKFEGKLLFCFEPKNIDNEMINEIKNGGGKIILSFFKLTYGVSGTN